MKIGKNLLQKDRLLDSPIFAEKLKMAALPGKFLSIISDVMKGAKYDGKLSFC